MYEVCPRQTKLSPAHSIPAPACGDILPRQGAPDPGTSFWWPTGARKVAEHRHSYPVQPAERVGEDEWSNA